MGKEALKPCSKFAVQHGQPHNQRGQAQEMGLSEVASQSHFAAH